MVDERFTVYKTIGMTPCWCVNDNKDDKVVMDTIIHKFEADRLCGKLNDLHNNRQKLAQGFDEYQAKVGYVIGKYARMFNRDTSEFQLIEEIADELGFDLESMEAKDGYANGDMI